MIQRLGLSGDKLMIEGNEIVKTCCSNQERFIRNADKQRCFQSPYMSSVPISKQDVINGQNHIRMPYLKRENTIVWLSKATDNQLDTFITKLTNHLMYSLDVANTKEFDYDVWHQKIDQLSKVIDKPMIASILNALNQLMFSNDLYYGEYHGDLTLTNMLVSDEIEIDVIDFLDCFISTPIHDFVKLRQDTKHHWTLHLLQDVKFNEEKVSKALKLVDDKISSLINQDVILNEYYLPFQILNLIRIIPYNKDPAITAYLEREISALYNDLKHRI